MTERGAHGHASFLNRRAADRSALALALLAAAACASTAQTVPSGSSAPESRAALRAAYARREAAIRTGMEGHEKIADAVRDAVERGDLEKAKAEARTLSERQFDGSTSELWHEKTGMMRDAASEIENAQDLKEAGRDVAIIARVCGGCHEEYGRPDVLVDIESSNASGARASMQQHQWAVERLWDGLVVPSDTAWSAGAQILSDNPLVLGLPTDGAPSMRRIGELVALVHKIGSKAVKTNQAADRAELFGQLLVTCAECHEWVGGTARARVPVNCGQTAVAGTASTGMADVRSTCSATLPRRACESPLRPRVPRTRRWARPAVAALRILSDGSPLATAHASHGQIVLADAVAVVNSARASRSRASMGRMNPLP